jgi:hypothetical protein
MLTYRVRPRVIKFEPATRIQPPVSADVTFAFAPKQCFGTDSGGGRSAVRAVPATVTFNRSSGQYSVESTPPLAPISLLIEQKESRLSIIGERVTVTKMVASEKELSSLIETVYYLLPLLLAVEFADPPIVEEVRGAVDGADFGWYLVEWRAELLTTTQERQTHNGEGAWRRLQRLAASDNRRLVAALHYFHVAARLERVSASPGEFLAEALLNYSKILEVLFSPSRDVVRTELKSLGYSEDEIERDFIPAMLLRSQVDVAHVSLTLFNDDQLSTLHRYADRAEASFRRLLSRLLLRFDQGTLVLPQYQLHSADPETAVTIERMARSLDALGDRP